MKNFLEFVIVRYSFYEPWSMSDLPNIRYVVDYFEGLQRQICEALEAIDGEQTFSLEEIKTPGGGHARPRVLDGGQHIERGAVQFTHSIGQSLPPAASERNPHLAGKGFQAAAISFLSFLGRCRALA